MLSSPAMPELPEVETIRRSLVPCLLGRRVVSVEARRVRLREGITPQDWQERVAGTRLEALERRGKFLIAHFERASALFHLGMSGRLVLTRPQEPHAPHTHLTLRFEHGVELRLVDPRRFGAAVVLGAEQLAEHPALGRLGRDPLEAGIGEVLRERAARSRAPIRNLLLDQTVLAGLGNIYANEALARAGIHPLRRARAISGARIVALGRAIQELLREALAAGGTTLDDGGFVDANGQNGYFAVKLGVYDRAGEACPRCAGMIVRRNAGGRSVYFCPRCQR